MDSTYIDLCGWKAFWSPVLENCHGGKEKPRASACPNIETARTCEHLKGCSWAVLLQATPIASKRRGQEFLKHWKLLQDEIITCTSHCKNETEVLVCTQAHPTLPRKNQSHHALMKLVLPPSAINPIKTTFYNFLLRKFQAWNMTSYCTTATWPSLVNNAAKVFL